MFINDEQGRQWEVIINSADGSIQSTLVANPTSPSTHFIKDEQGRWWQVWIDSTDGSLQESAVTNPSSVPSPFCTLTIQSVVNWARTQAKLVPIIGVGGFSNEPAISIANNVMQEFLAQPYNWKWNRVEADPLTTAEFTQDYTATLSGSPISNMGWMESAVREDTNSTSRVKPRDPIQAVKDLQLTSDYGNPEKISYLIASDYSIHWRLWPIPISQTWTIYPTYQAKPPILTSLAQTWQPIPDELGFVIRQGFLAMTLKHAGNPSWLSEYQIFQGMLSKACGIADAEQQDSTFYPMRPIMLG